MRLAVFGALALGLIGAAQADPAAQQPLNLTCGGGGTANKTTAATAYSNTNVSGMVGTTPVMGSGNTTTTVYGHTRGQKTSFIASMRR